MTPDLTNLYHRVFVEVFGLYDAQSATGAEIEAQMRAVATAADDALAVDLLTAWGYRDRNGDGGAAALFRAVREVRERLRGTAVPQGEIRGEEEAVDAIGGENMETLPLNRGWITPALTGPVGYVHPYIGMTFRLHMPRTQMFSRPDLPEVNIPRAVCVALDHINGTGTFRDVATNEHHRMSVTYAVGPLEDP